MGDKKTYITIVHGDDFNNPHLYEVNETLLLKKERNNEYDDEAIAVYRRDRKAGYVANSVFTVARGTCSAGRLYDRFDDEAECVVRFVITENAKAIAEIM